MINVASSRHLANLILALASEVIATSHIAPAISYALPFCYVFDTLIQTGLY